MLVDLQHEIGGQLEVQVHVYRQQRIFGAGIRFHGEWHGNGNRQIVLIVVQVNLITEVATLSALANDDDAGVVEHRHGS
ncbi:hypothetical protein D3C86_1989310 [compost metagenome]